MGKIWIESTYLIFLIIKEQQIHWACFEESDIALLLGDNRDKDTHGLETEKNFLNSLW